MEVDTLKIFFILIALLLIASCATPLPTAHNPGVSMVAANATGTVAAYSIFATGTAYASERMATASAATATREAMISHEQTVVAATAVSQVSTAAAGATATVVVVRTAVSFQTDRRQIENDALGTRIAMDTDATRVARRLSEIEQREASERWRVVIPLALFFTGLFLAGLGTAAVKLFHRNADTLRDRDGDVIAIRGRLIIPEMEFEEPERARPGIPRNNAPPLNAELPSFTLVDNISHEQVFKFSGQAINRMIINVHNGDMGFRRETSGAGLGLNDLADLADNGTYGDIVTAMLGKRWITEYETNRYRWTESGLTDMLRTQLSPHRR